MKRILLWLIPISILLLVGIYFFFTLGRPAPVAMKYEIYEGVTYRRIVKYLPHAMIVHVIIIDRKTAEPKFFVTPPDDIEGGVLAARTTSQFLEEFGVQIAINGDGFFPWRSNSPADYYPHVGDPVTPNGFAASGENIYYDGLGDPHAEPILYVSRRNEISFNRPPNKIFQAIAGDRMLMLGGEIVPDLDNEAIHPRTAIGVNKNGRYIYLVVVDGRQPFYSAGATFQELAQLLKDLGAHYAMALDGGGSSTLVIRDENGNARVLNSPIDQYIPGKERVVANHFGVYLNE
ncbi:MAG: phosphodiester glycosidase family protein [Anaerolineales bacterium]|nr:phosphodiester glycosidase family protein [Anaerolineales bacterium]